MKLIDLQELLGIARGLVSDLEGHVREKERKVRGMAKRARAAATNRVFKRILCTTCSRKFRPKSSQDKRCTRCRKGTL